MKVANIIIAHKNPAQLLRLVRQFSPEYFHNFIHIDGRCDLSQYKDVISHPSVTLVKKRRKVVWTGYGFVGVTIDAMHQIRETNERFFYFNVMSGLDFPIRATAEFYNLLKSTYEHGPKEFFEILELDEWPGSHRRYERFHLIEWTARGRYFLEKIINRFVPKRKFYDGKFKPYGRAAWFTASDQFVDYALRYFKEHPDYIKFLKTVWNPDEFTWTSLVMNSPFQKNVSDYLRYIDWSEKKASPKVFRLGDLPDLLNSEKFIARKFDETIDSEILDRLEQAVAAGLVRGNDEKKSRIK